MIGEGGSRRTGNSGQTCQLLVDATDLAVWDLTWDKRPDPGPKNYDPTLLLQIFRGVTSVILARACLSSGLKADFCPSCGKTERGSLDRLLCWPSDGLARRVSAVPALIFSL